MRRFHPRPWLVVGGDVSLSRGHFTDVDPSAHLNDVHLHPTIPRTLRVNFIVGRQ